MKKLIIVLAVGMVASNGIAQSSKNNVAPLPPQKEIKDVPPLPPPPPTEANFAQPPAPPPPPPMPPKPPVKVKRPIVVNEKGYSILVHATKDEPVILLTKNGVTQKIRMRVWNAKPEYFENKYGKLPPPPPPMPAPPILPTME